MLVLSLPTISNANAAATAASEGQSRPDTQTVMIYHSFPTQTDLKIGCNNTLKHNYETNNFMHGAQDYRNVQHTFAEKGVATITVPLSVARINSTTFLLMLSIKLQIFYYIISVFLIAHYIYPAKTSHIYLVTSLGMVTENLLCRGCISFSEF